MFSHNIVMKALCIVLFTAMIAGCSSGNGSSSSSGSGKDWSGVYYFTLDGDTDAPILVVINSTSDVYSSIFSHTGGSYVATSAAFTLTLTDSENGDFIFTVDAGGAFVLTGAHSGSGNVSTVEDRSALQGNWSGNIDNTAGNTPVNKSVSFDVDSMGALSNISGLTGPFTGSYAFLDEFNKVRIIIRTAATDEWVFVNLGTGTGADSTSSSLVGTQVELDNGAGTSGTFSFSLSQPIIAPQSSN